MREVAGDRTGDNDMTTHHNHTHENEPGHDAHHDRDTPTRSGPHTLPAGGWIREITTSENWRTTTIVQRHRDRAAMTPCQ
jgi:hypothetical protein